MAQSTIQQQVSGYTDAVKEMKVFVGIELFPLITALIASVCLLYFLGFSVLTVVLCIAVLSLAVLLTVLMILLRLVNYMIFLAKYTNAVQTPLMRTLNGVFGG